MLNLKRDPLHSFVEAVSLVLLITLVATLVLASLDVSAQQQRPSGSKSFIGWTAMDYYDVSLTAGRFLPFGVIGVRDNYPMWAIAGGIPSALGIVELEYGNIQGEGVIWHQGSLGLRWDFDIFSALEGYLGIGANAIYYKRRRTILREFDFVNAGGYHLRWGVFQPVTDSFRIRADFKFNSNPGRTLYVGLGFNLRF
ncbi:MAG: hypothetical protein HRT45_12830 [Bdellovibrionales bacterium]|nr:hypothetical protein [Bdellovibrionales bacterium]